MCICGNTPVSVLQMGTPEKVRELTKQQIDAAGKAWWFYHVLQGRSG